MINQSSVEKSKSNGVGITCCGKCLLLYKQKDGRSVWLCKKGNNMRISNLENTFCKEYAEK